MDNKKDRKWLWINEWKMNVQHTITMTFFLSVLVGVVRTIPKGWCRFPYLLPLTREKPTRPNRKKRQLLCYYYCLRPGYILTVTPRIYTYVLQWRLLLFHVYPCLSVPSHPYLYPYHIIPIHVPLLSVVIMLVYVGWHGWFTLHTTVCS
jgi:hypothetical protein